MSTIIKTPLYCHSLTEYQRFLTREVRIGNLTIGGDHPIAVQSMTTTNTMDTEATVKQSIRMIEAGCDIVRITAPSKNEAENLANIKQAIRAAGYDTPLVADIHYTPNAAEIAARIVEKVRVNPGNYADKKKFQVIEYTDTQYQAELDRIREKFTPLVRICKEYGTAMRIGTNHGSLSDRIMSRYGDTPLGMVESALEFLRICEDEHYHQIVLSMKASNPQVMVQAYRLLVSKMQEEGMNYPLHLGVTEAGDGEDARIKSAMGIGALLEDGLGDTIRVSLTEDPVHEVPVGRMIAERYTHRKGHQSIEPIEEAPFNPYEYEKRDTIAVNNVGGQQVPVVIADIRDRPKDNPLELKGYGYEYDPLLDKWHIRDMAADFIYVGDQDVRYELPGTLRKIVNAKSWQPGAKGSYPLFKAAEYVDAGERHPVLNFVRATIHDLTDPFIARLKSDQTAVLVLESKNEASMPEMRRAFFKLIDTKCQIPVILKRDYPKTDLEHFLLHAATDTGALLIDGMGDGVWLTAKEVFPKQINDASFGILQASRTRISKTEYISCPSCGRTLFDLEETTAKIRNATHHLKGVKIGIMGCIVNGPGEMADADYGYVGSGPGKITLYKGKEVVKRSIPTEDALDELIDLIKEHGDWVEMESSKV